VNRSRAPPDNTVQENKDNKAPENMGIAQGNPRDSTGMGTIGTFRCERLFIARNYGNLCIYYKARQRIVVVLTIPSHAQPVWTRRGPHSNSYVFFMLFWLAFGVCLNPPLITAQGPNCAQVQISVTPGIPKNNGPTNTPPPNQGISLRQINQPTT